LGDFIIVHNGKIYGVELGAGGKTAKQLRDLSTKIGEGVEKVTGTVDEVIEAILGK
jgi:hypothetical protein